MCMKTTWSHGPQMHHITGPSKPSRQAQQSNGYRPRPHQPSIWIWAAVMSSYTRAMVVSLIHKGQASVVIGLFRSLFLASVSHVDGLQLPLAAPSRSDLVISTAAVSCEFSLRISRLLRGVCPLCGWIRGWIRFSGTGFGGFEVRSRVSWRMDDGLWWCSGVCCDGLWNSVWWGRQLVLYVL